MVFAESASLILNGDTAVSKKALGAGVECRSLTGPRINGSITGPENEFTMLLRIDAIPAKETLLKTALPIHERFK